MSNVDIVLLALSVHQLLCAWLLLKARRHRRSFNYAHFWWILLIPVFGPLAGFSLVNALGRKPPDADWLAQKEERYRMHIVSHSNHRKYRTAGRSAFNQRPAQAAQPDDEHPALRPDAVSGLCF